MSFAAGAVMTGGSLVSQSLIADARAKICSVIVNQYGSTEAGATAFATADRLVGVEGSDGLRRAVGER